MSAAVSRKRWRAVAFCRLLCVGIWLATAPVLVAQEARTTPATNLWRLKQLGLTQSSFAHPFRLNAQVAWASRSRRSVALMDATGGLILELNSPLPSLQTGDLIRLSGSGTVTQNGNVFKIGVDGLRIDNDSLHPTNELTGTGFLPSGYVPIRVQWFNESGAFALEVSFEGPGLPRSRIDDASLYRTPEQVAPTNAGGLNYQCYEGSWLALPDFDKLTPVKIGTVRNLDLNARSRNEGIALQFTGLLRVPKPGRYKFYLNSDDGSRLFIGPTNFQAEVIGRAELPPARIVSVGQLLAEDQDGSWCQIEGQVTKIRTNEDGLRAELSVGQATLDIQLPDGTSAANLSNRLVRARGFCMGAFGGDGLKVPHLLLVPDGCIEPMTSLPVFGPETNTMSRPILTTISDVHRLKREEAQLGYTAHVRGVVTSIDPSFYGLTVQDSERGIYVQGVTNRMNVGDFVEVEGFTDPGLFSPMLRMRRLTLLGQGRLPPPIHPNWDQLNNGSLDAQYVEIEGVVVSTVPGSVELLTSGGRLNVDLYYGLKPELMGIYENMFVRIRGTLIAIRNGVTHQVLFGRIRICDPLVTGQNADFAEIGSAPTKTPLELLLFDPKATWLERVRMSGQIVHVAGDTCFMMDGGSGVRFQSNHARDLKAGDVVEVAGYPQLGGPSPLLRAAVARKTDHGSLPTPRTLNPGDLPCPACDATLVQVEGVLNDVRTAGWEKDLDLQNGAYRFVACVTDRSNLLHLPTGCRLQLTGTYAVLGGNQALEYSPSLYELLLNSPADVRILARPPWWTLRRLLIMVAMLLAILTLAGVWINQLHRKVEERTTQLEEQIRKRQVVEQQRAMEQERARVAHDLHDELGSGLTEIGMLATVPTDAREIRTPMDQIAERARNMVTTLDEIVWAMNPKHDLVNSLGSYLCLYADHFLKLANINCRLKGSLELPNTRLNPIHRHEFFLAFKEALNNIVRHSGATTVQLNIRMIGSRLRVSLADNGTGLRNTKLTPDMEGLSGMEIRLKRIGGRFTLATQAGRGTILRFYMPVD